MARIIAQNTTPERLDLKIEGRLDSSGVGDVWGELDRAVHARSGRPIHIDASGVDYCDTAGVSLFVQLRRWAEATGSEISLEGLPEQARQMLAQFTEADFQTKAPEAGEPFNLAVEVGKATTSLAEDFREQVRFIGELSSDLFMGFVNPRRVRWRDVMLATELAGVNSLAIVSLVGFLMGLIMAFQAANQMKQFGAEIYVADIIGMSMFRELGPLLAAIILAGRSGSAFAAEIGTMKVNEEIDALTTMGLNPVRFLVVPRVIAGVAVMPFLNVFSILAGLVGGGVVMRSLGYPLITYRNQIVQRVTLTDAGSGMIKAVVFGLLVAGIGCLRGLQTGSDSSAVGVSTTSAVVSGIVLIVVADGVFSFVYYYLGI